MFGKYYFVIIILLLLFFYYDIEHEAQINKSE